MTKINKMKNRIIIFDNIRFFDYSFKKILEIILKGGLLVAPAASALTYVKSNKIYRKSLANSNIAIFDSGFFCLLLRIIKNINVTKFSGYKFLKLFLNDKSVQNLKILIVDPNKDESKSNLKLLKKKHFKNIINYVAPIYKKIEDQKLLRLINKERPKIVLINIGGGKQEPLGYFLKQKVKFQITIICTGAAIAFLTNKQAPVNDTIDKYYLGWLIRFLYNPADFKRIFVSLKLITLVIKSKIKIIKN